MNKINLNALNNTFEENLFRTTKNKLPKKIAVAVSGGADSMALAFLIAEFAKHLPIDLYAYTVDHKLRKSSKKEAEFVHSTLSKMGYVHEILNWDGKKPKTKIEETARKKRYELMFKECKKLKIDYLATAHHKDDQIETLLMRFFKGSGVDGLCGIPSIREEQGIKIIRPLLYLSKQEIIDICKTFKIKWKEDKSNKSDKFERNKIRKLCTYMKNKNLLTDEILLARERAIDESTALINIATKEFANLVTEKSDKLTLNKKNFFALEKEIQIRLLQKCMDNFYKGKYSCKRKSIENVINKLSENKGSTLRKCFIKTSRGKIIITKE
ncbi:MAG: tRNA lysidine(34) synthetase TilS [Alphaproteobacteria bacterium]|jgi:tRNA(Ile)-lysidine synthase|nr:tRNA lysidine(34) synthetase TilS [Alphaproteobacteria bacterium]